MIVKKLWTTNAKKKYFHFEGHLYGERTRHWKGYFLFGIVPLYVECLKSVYY